MQFCLKLLLIIQSGLWNLVVTKRILDCHDLKGEGTLLEAVMGEDITIECQLPESIKQCVWTPQNSSYPECTAPMNEESSIIFAQTRPNYICSFRPSHCSLSFTTIQRENMGVWTLGTVSSTNAFYQYFAILVRNKGVVPRSRVQSKTDDSCFLTDTIFQTDASVFQHLDEVESPQECQVKCQEIGKCTYWTWADSDMKSLSKHCFLRDGDDDGLGKERQHFVSGPKYCSDSEWILRRLSKTLRRPKEGVNEAKFSVTTLMISVVVAVVLMAVDVGQPIPVTKLISLVQRKVVPLPNEFKRLTDADRAKNIIAKSREIGKSKLNISLNRVRHILPYDECRLILNTKIEDSDYINASLMPGTPDIGNLIACQIPSNEVEDHYWQMIAENPIGVVVNLDENSRKYHQI